MKKIILNLLLGLFYFTPQVYALEEVVLEAESLKEDIQAADFRNVFLKHLQENDTESKTPSYLLEEVLTKHFDNSLVESAHLFGYYRAAANLDIDSDDTDLTYTYSSINAGVNGKFKDGKTYYEARVRFNPQHNYKFFQYLPSNMYIANQSIPHHTLIVGYTRTPTGKEGGMSLTNIPFVAKSQISRNYGNVRKFGVRVKGDYDFIEYDLGGYSSDTYFRKFFPGAEFAGWLNVKPLGAETLKKYGVLKLGGGITAGQNNIDYFVSGAYVGYEYKNFTADFEWAKANGYNGAKKLTKDKSEGFYTTLGYKITPKIQLVTRYDQFTPNLQNSSDIRRETSFGINYFIRGQALKVMLNYIYSQKDLYKDSHRILLGTQILL